MHHHPDNLITHDVSRVPRTFSMVWRVISRTACISEPRRTAIFITDAFVTFVLHRLGSMNTPDGCSSRIGLAAEKINLLTGRFTRACIRVKRECREISIKRRNSQRYFDKDANKRKLQQSTFAFCKMPIYKSYCN